MVNSPPVYRGRLAPSPTGYLHLGHARTFWTAQERARAAGGALVLRNDDLDAARCRPEFAAAMLEDLRWFGFRWDEGPDVGGPHAPYRQSERHALYREAFEKLRAAGAIYPCICSRRDVEEAAAAPHEQGDEPLYPGTCRPENLPAEERDRREALARRSPELACGEPLGPELVAEGLVEPVEWGEGRANWRLHVPDGETLIFADGHFGGQRAVAGQHFGDFLVWRKDDTPSYQLACVVDDAAMRITEVVRGADLLISTFRQLLLYRALGLAPPTFYHCPLLTDERGQRLAKRHDALALRTLQAQGRSPAKLRAAWL